MAFARERHPFARIISGPGNSVKKKANSYSRGKTPNKNQFEGTSNMPIFDTVRFKFIQPWKLFNQMSLNLQKKKFSLPAKPKIHNMLLLNISNRQSNKKAIKVF